MIVEHSGTKYAEHSFHQEMIALPRAVTVSPNALLIVDSVVVVYLTELSNSYLQVDRGGGNMLITNRNMVRREKKRTVFCTPFNSIMTYVVQYTDPKGFSFS